MSGGYEDLPDSLDFAAAYLCGQLDLADQGWAWLDGPYYGYRVALLRGAGLYTGDREAPIQPWILFALSRRLLRGPHDQAT